jgi:triacylglycerol lipase
MKEKAHKAICSARAKGIVIVGQPGQNRSHGRQIHRLVFVALCLTLLLIPGLLSAMNQNNDGFGAGEEEIMGFSCFDADAREFNWKNSYLLMYSCYFAYETLMPATGSVDFTSKFREHFSRLGMKSCDLVEEKNLTYDTQAVVMSNDHLVIVAFRGSEGRLTQGLYQLEKFVKDWLLTDANIGKKEMPDWGKKIWVHQGFYGALDVAWDSLTITVNKHLQGTDKKLWFTGHSLGGALAVLASFRFALAGIPVQGVYTFGQPRVGNKTFVKAHAKKISHFEQWENNGDLVTKIPPLTLGFRHIKRKNYLPKTGEAVLGKKLPSLGLRMKTHKPRAYVQRMYEVLPVKERTGLPLPPTLDTPFPENVENDLLEMGSRNGAENDSDDE